MFGRDDQEPAFSGYHVGHLEETVAKALDTVPASEGLASPRGWKGEQTAGTQSSVSALRKLQHARVNTIWGRDREMTLRGGDF